MLVDLSQFVSVSAFADAAFNRDDSRIGILAYNAGVVTLLQYSVQKIDGERRESAMFVGAKSLCRIRWVGFR